MWVATGDGLVCFRSPEDTDYKTYQRKDGFANTFIQAITEDQQGNIWFSTNKGIGCYVTKKNGSITMDTLTMFLPETL